MQYELLIQSKNCTLAKCVDPDQMPHNMWHLIRVYTVCNNERRKKELIFVIIINIFPLNGKWTGLLGKVKGSIRYYNGSR